MVTQIATAAHQQTSVTEEVNRNLEQITKVTGETASGAQSGQGVPRAVEPGL